MTKSRCFTFCRIIINTLQRNEREHKDREQKNGNVNKANRTKSNETNEERNIMRKGSCNK